MGSCCTPDNSCSTTETTAVAVADSTVTVYAVSGMTCGHCKSAITKSVSALDGVISVDVDVAGGLVTVTTGGEPDDAAITAAVDDAGYELTGRA
ncbi:heavy-metal-associated domain-containing protein [Streptomyces litmocidini]|uniref:Copper-binding protein n=3 Tax=Streptomyces TaxID=1883 RepID=A0A0B5I1S3_9ACTN|nr:MULTISPECIES: heavy-metal-associated domain-containing protein [Streptomyces]AJF66551.1 copper-binding protein [Streptomyces vietnamensis]ROQ33538.1 copper chaperone CopZ [Streptomyces sp. PanSC19]